MDLSPRLQDIATVVPGGARVGPSLTMSNSKKTHSRRKHPAARGIERHPSLQSARRHEGRAAASFPAARGIISRNRTSRTVAALPGGARVQTQRPHRHIGSLSSRRMSSPRSLPDGARAGRTFSGRRVSRWRAGGPSLTMSNSKGYSRVAANPRRRAGNHSELGCASDFGFLRVSRGGRRRSVVDFTTTSVATPVTAARQFFAAFSS